MINFSYYDLDKIDDELNFIFNLKEKYSCNYVNDINFNLEKLKNMDKLTTEESKLIGEFFINYEKSNKNIDKILNLISKTILYIKSDKEEVKKCFQDLENAFLSLKNLNFKYFNKYILQRKQNELNKIENLLKNQKDLVTKYLNSTNKKIKKCYIKKYISNEEEIYNNYCRLDNIISIKKYINNHIYPSLIYWFEEAKNFFLKNLVIVFTSIGILGYILLLFYFNLYLDTNFKLSFQSNIELFILFGILAIVYVFYLFMIFFNLICFAYFSSDCKANKILFVILQIYFILFCGVLSFDFRFISDNFDLFLFIYIAILLILFFNLKFKNGSVIEKIISTFIVFVCDFLFIVGIVIIEENISSGAIILFLAIFLLMRLSAVYYYRYKFLLFLMLILSIFIIVSLSGGLARVVAIVDYRENFTILREYVPKDIALNLPKCFKDYNLTCVENDSEENITLNNLIVRYENHNRYYLRIFIKDEFTLLKKDLSNFNNIVKCSSNKNNVCFEKSQNKDLVIIKNYEKSFYKKDFYINYKNILN